MSWHRHRLAASISRFLHVTSYIKGCLGLGCHAVVPSALPDIVPGCMSMHTAPVRLQGSVRGACPEASWAPIQANELTSNHARHAQLACVFKDQGALRLPYTTMRIVSGPLDAICMNRHGQAGQFRHWADRWSCHLVSNAARANARTIGSMFEDEQRFDIPGRGSGCPGR